MVGNLILRCIMEIVEVLALLQEICMVNHNQVPQLQDLVNMLSYKRFLSQAPICMEHHNQLGITCTRFSWRTVVKQEWRFMLKLSRMLAMVNPREMMTILNMVVVQLKMLQVQVQGRMDQNMNHQGRLLILRQMSQYLIMNPVRFLACADAKGEENMFDDKLRNEDTTWRHSKDKDDRVAADLSSTPQGSKELKIKRFTSITQGRVYFKGEFVNTLPK
ncbi:hypothetical protein HanIR_Chr15g0752991 [Helianthus annuus]|nr:hypothetical protein HanIR_Chr15g0752991 [Helianthus annuus]